MNCNKLPKEFYLAPTQAVARELLGKIFVKREPEGGYLTARIVETEAYLGSNDDACHASRGMTSRNRAMFEPGGIAYVYKIYGMHFCINVVTEEAGCGSAALIRAGEPLEGGEIMRARRGIDKLEDALKGPGNFCRALGIDLRHNYADLQGEDIYICDAERIPDEQIAVTGRIGITQGKDLLYRYFIKSSPFVSGKKVI
ncbi:MAG: DNA-3-methyladenine glycosylase [Chloroflexota bacterium]